MTPRKPRDQRDGPSVNGTDSSAARPSGNRPPDGDPESPARRRSMQRLSELLPGMARRYGLEEELDQARLAAAWQQIVAQRVPAAAGSCRLVGLEMGVATIETDEAITAQEIRLRSPELLAALRGATRVPVQQLRLTTRHV